MICIPLRFTLLCFSTRLSLEQQRPQVDILGTTNRIALQLHTDMFSHVFVCLIMVGRAGRDG